MSSILYDADEAQDTVTDLYETARADGTTVWKAAGDEDKPPEKQDRQGSEVVPRLLSLVQRDGLELFHSPNGSYYAASTEKGDWSGGPSIE